MYQYALHEVHAARTTADTYHELWNVASEARKYLVVDEQIETPISIGTVFEAQTACRVAGSLWSVDYAAQTARVWLDVVGHIRDLYAASRYHSAHRATEQLPSPEAGIPEGYSFEIGTEVA